MHGYLRSSSKAFPNHSFLFHHNLQWLPVVLASTVSFSAQHTRLSLSNSSCLPFQLCLHWSLFLILCFAIPNYSLSSTHAKCVLSLLRDFVHAVAPTSLFILKVPSILQSTLWALWLSFSTYHTLPCITAIHMHLLDFKLSRAMSFHFRILSLQTSLGPQIEFLSIHDCDRI